MDASHGKTGQIEAVAEDLICSVKRYTREQPATALLVALGIGFVLGWRLKPW